MPGGRLGSWLVATATALVILGGSILPFLTPAYIRVEQDRSGVERLTGWDAGQVNAATTAILHDLVLGGDFTTAPSSTPALRDPERAHMQDVRGVFQGFYLLVLFSIAVLAVAFRRARDTGASAATWRAVGRGARGLAIGLAGAGAFAILAFDAAFEVFHRLFFSSGTYTFDPRTDRLVQLFPQQFWSDTAIAVGVVAVVVALATAWAASRRAGGAHAASAFVTSKAMS